MSKPTGIGGVAATNVFETTRDPNHIVFRRSPRTATAEGLLIILDLATGPLYLYLIAHANHTVKVPFGTQYVNPRYHTVQPAWSTPYLYRTRFPGEYFTSQHPFSRRANHRYL